MKKYISALALSICFFGAAYAQETETTEAQQELQAIMDEGLVKFKTEDGKFSFRVGARVDIDGAHYIDDYTDRSSGVPPPPCWWRAPWAPMSCGVTAFPPRAC